MNIISYEVNAGLLIFITQFSRIKSIKYETLSFFLSALSLRFDLIVATEATSRLASI